MVRDGRGWAARRTIAAISSAAFAEGARSADHGARTRSVERRRGPGWGSRAAGGPARGARVRRAAAAHRQSREAVLSLDRAVPGRRRAGTEAARPHSAHVDRAD